MNTIEIKWEDLRVGDMFLDGSVVTEIRPWTEEECYVLESQGQELVVSYSHLIKAEVRVGGEMLNSAFSLSRNVRSDIGINDELWVSAKDLYTVAGLPDSKIRLISGDEKHILTGITPYKDHEKLKVRCITTSTGEYRIGPFLNHNTGGKDLEGAKKRDVINKTFDGYRTSYIVQEAIDAKTTEEARNIIYTRLKDEYEENGIKMDDFNIKIIAKKLTSYKRDPSVGTRYVRDDEKCDIVSIGSIGNSSNPLKKAELQNAYKNLTVPGVHKLNPDAANEIIL